MEVLVGPTMRIKQTRRGVSSGYREEEEYSSDSSIGVPDDNDEEEEEEEEDGVVPSVSVYGKLKKGSGSLGCLASLEDSLPVKRGLSLHISGKSKSFMNLAEASVGTAKDLEKREHPFNKKRRMLRWSKNCFSGYYKWSSPVSMPVLPLIEDEDNDAGDEEEEEEEEKEGDQGTDWTEQSSPGSKQRLNHGVLKSRSCFTLADLPEEDDDEEVDW
ncbi:hypothetical protein SAY86_031172 [Trapa natans]|uniref:Uncharacterized protein n=1 Tax=Trapa natans TaxID=22666 RepID=A0AAN7MPJ1_TRANT|nr:hypothetical protein SAY86_031172 [Trapa natans]